MHVRHKTSNGSLVCLPNMKKRGVPCSGMHTSVVCKADTLKVVFTLALTQIAVLDQNEADQGVKTERTTLL